MTWDHNRPLEYLRRQGGRMDPLVVSVAISGGVHGKEVNPHLPETPEEQAEEAGRCYEAGASIVHVHARDPRAYYARASGRVEDYLNVFRLVRERCHDMIVSITGAGGPNLSYDERQGPLGARPEMADIDMGPISWNLTLKQRRPPLGGREQDELVDTVVPITVSEQEDRARRMAEADIKAECAVFSTGQWASVYHLVENGLVKPPYLCQILMGVHGGDLPTPDNLLANLQHVPEDSIVSVAALGRHETPILATGIILGLNVVVGLENNIFYSRGKLAEGNAPLVERVIRLAHELGRTIATPAQARSMLGLSQEPRTW